MDNTRTSVPHIPVDTHAFASVSASMGVRSSFVGAMLNFGAVAIMFPTISRRYLEDILHSRLDVKKIIRFIGDFSSMVASEKVDAPDAKSLNDLIHSFDMYAYILLALLFRLR